MKILAVICCGLLLAACAPQTKDGRKSLPEAEIPFDQQLFIDGLNQLTQQQEPASLFELKNNFPGSPWTEQATAILEMKQQLERQKRELAHLKKQLAEPAPDKARKQAEEQLSLCKEENERLQLELDALNKKLEALRELTIEMELK